MTTHRRRALLEAPLGFALVPPFGDPRPPVIAALHRWLDTWPGIALIGAGMARRPAINRTASVRGVLRAMRGDAARGGGSTGLARACRFAITGRTATRAAR